MADSAGRFSRRGFLASAAGLSLAGGASPAPARHKSLSTDGRAPLAVLGTVYRPLSYTYHLTSRFLHGWMDDGQPHRPAHYVKSLWIDQVPENDLSRELAKTFGFFRARTVHDALTEGRRLGVQGVMITAEHGNYPRNDDGQILYPRFEVFAQLVAAFHEVGQTAPVYLARQLSHDVAKAKQIVAWSRQLGFPLMAGSPLPFCERVGDLNPCSAPEEILVAGFGPVEVGGFDALEALQCLAEQRSGGESGVAAITCLTGREVWHAGDVGRWSWALLEAALANSPSANLGDVRNNVGQMAVAGMPATPPVAFQIEYRDGTRGTVLLLNGHVQDFTAAMNPRSPRAGLFEVLPLPGLRHFDRLASAQERFFATGEAPAPIERTLLTTGMLSAAMRSHAARGLKQETPDLDIAYAFA